MIDVVVVVVVIVVDGEHNTKKICETGDRSELCVDLMENGCVLLFQISLAVYLCVNVFLCVNFLFGKQCTTFPDRRKTKFTRQPFKSSTTICQFRWQN